MTPNNDDREGQLKAAAISARRARRASWRNAHVDRLAREREARQIAKDYRQAQRAAGKQCSSCAQTLSLDSFSPAFKDRPTARCKACVAAATRERYHRDLDKARSRTRNRPQATPERQRQRAERQRHTADRQDRREQERRRKAAERQRQTAARMTHLTAVLMGTDLRERISSQEGWDMATSELQRLWLQSGDKDCVSCKATVPPSAMLPPGPGNFYPGKCRSCASAEYREHQLRVYGRLTEVPQILLRDGSTITVAEFARRCREREQRNGMDLSQPLQLAK